MTRMRTVGLPASNGGYTRHFGSCCLANQGIQIFVEVRGFLVQHLAPHLFGMLTVHRQPIQLTGGKYRGIDKFGDGSIGLHLGHLPRLRNGHSYAPVRVAVSNRRRRLPKGKNYRDAFRVLDDSNSMLQYELFRLQILYLFTYGVHVAAFGATRAAADDFVGQELQSRMVNNQNANLIIVLKGCQYPDTRSEEHTSELQSRDHLVC